ncbi:ankyrin repeat-containing protein ITN1-like isoform X2 [Quercus robur]|uniref:ankyrin repeat-containing protein ITN1-like isoform X2 n=1 Tax=Quercus robur TaxID=38942 RepID=UPI00216340E2|nr:ankyrin repeat-containing protein ITN1-like isoform X2 [Quercus robur]
MPPKRRGEIEVTTEERVNSSPPTCFQSSSPSSCKPALGPQINLTRQKSYSFEGSSFHQLQPICNSNSSNQLSALPFSHRINLSTSIPGPSIGAMPMEEDICLDAAGLSTQTPSGSQIECATPNRELSYLILCDGKKRNDNHALCLAALKGDWKTAKSFIDKDRSMLYARLTKSWDRLIHIAVHSKCIYFIKELVEYGTVEDLAIENLNKDTGLSIAAVSGMVEVAKLMIEKNNKLTMKRGTRELIPFGMAAEVGHKEMAEYLYSKTEFDCLDHSGRIRLFFITLSSNLYGLALEILTRYPTMACERDENNDGKTALHVLAQKATDIAGGSLLKIVARYTSLYFKNFYKQASMPILDRDLIERIWEQVLQRSDEEISDLIRRPSGVLFDAALSGNVEFLALLLSKDYIVGNVDVDKNNMLHLAGMLPLAERLGAPRANLQMQRELLWFKEVEKIVRPFHMYMKNSEGMTPIEVFNKDHKELLKVGEEAMKETANSCMLVATLISTVVFAAALTVPGASNKILNTPFFGKEEWFMIFILSNAISLFASAASIVLLLSILTSRYAQNDFMYSLHARLMFGLTTLFISITTMVMAFIAAIFLIFDYKMEWVPYVIASLACAPVVLFLVLHSNLWADLIHSYYWSKFLFRPSKYRIF